MSYEEVRRRARECELCPLCETRTHVVFGSGPVPCEVMLVGEAPGHDEDVSESDGFGIPFVGAAGRFLDEVLVASGLSRSKVYVTNVVKCRPPENRTPEEGEILSCRGYLDSELKFVQPKLVIMLGASALSRFFPKSKLSE